MSRRRGLGPVDPVPDGGPDKSRVCSCEHCGKWSYGSRRLARRAARITWPGATLQAYRCPVSRYWHYGHRR